MKRWIPLVGLVTLAACRADGTLSEARADEPKGTGIAVVELFTSEGCSSCPPADAFLGDLAIHGGGAVYPLAFHVDYWDSLGWSDRFASAANTERQGQYARAFGLRGLYTPQAVVDGVEQFVGSDRSRADEAISRALSRPASASVTVRARLTGAGSIAVDYETTGAPGSSTLNLAVVESSATSVVRAGENAGRTLHHANVVRSLTTVSLGAPKGSVELTMPRDLSPTQAEIIAFAQGSSRDGAMPVMGAARAPVQAP